MSDSSFEARLATLSQSSAPTHPRRRLNLFILPLIILAFFGLALYLQWDHLAPANEVTVVRARTVSGQTQANINTDQPATGAVAFQAAGWVEPAPFAAAIVPYFFGVLDEVRVVDGQLVEKGQTLAVLNADELLLDLKSAQVEVKRILAEMAQIDAKMAIAKADAEGLQKTLDLTRKQQKLQADLLADLKEAAGAVPATQLLEVERLSVELSREIASLANQLKSKQLALPELNAQKAALHEQLSLARVAEERVVLKLKRSVLKAPFAGRIMGLRAVPGGGVSPEEPILEMYDPQKLQVRVDVLFADAPLLKIGQPVKMTFDALPNVELKGEVTGLVGEADLQRNTIQAKVKLLETPDLIRPDMIARARFYTVPAENKELSVAPVSGGSKVFASIPEKALENRSGHDAVVWVVSRRAQRAEMRTVKLGEQSESNWVQIITGVGPGEWVVTKAENPLQEGQRVTVKSEVNHD